MWWDIHIPIGKTFAQVIEEELQAAKCILVLWSQASVKSHWVYSEAAEGRSRGILVPVFIEDVENRHLPLEFRLLQAARLVDWKGEENNPEFEKLLKAIETFTGRRRSPIVSTAAQEEAAQKGHDEREAECAAWEKERQERAAELAT